MESLSHYPLLVFALAFVALWLASAAGFWLRRRYPSADDEQNEHLGVILAATLTLLALIIGFSFSMSTNRYDQRKNFEEAEANAIGTELLRADLLPPADAANVRKLLGEYLDQRIRFYLNKDDIRRMRIDERDQPVAGRSLVGGPRSRDCTANAGCGAGTRRYERRDQFAGLYASGVLEPDSRGRVVSHGSHRAIFERAARLSVAKRQRCRKAHFLAAACLFDCLPFDRRYRCSAAWLD